MDDSPAICRAINRALESSGRLKKELARYLNVDATTVTHMVSDREPNLATIDRIERFLGKPHGWLLVQAGAVDMPHRIEDLIPIDSRLTEGVARLAEQSYRFSLSMSAEERGTVANNEPADASRRFTSASSAV